MLSTNVSVEYLTILRCSKSHDYFKPIRVHWCLSDVQLATLKFVYDIGYRAFLNGNIS